ncbi:AAA family ATPase [Salinimicrobium sediminilitoris]|uniref:AAA family ATPase n=1 Tax=Salinimicrobium sediminilitoris TaxID=2876715 RepID=UPI001E31B1F9|nr:AAA family ATPase [Salinimicrobium sediminilitoris]MCC8361000.1 ATP-dependent RecD-like DNA helicase [Salinimicrobium sediminilitoris]
MKHISIRLPWHDRGWDGNVCNHPAKNSYCKGFHSVNAERIRKQKDVLLEEKLKGQPIRSDWNYRPPCTETINVFGNEAVKHTHIPKSFIKNTSPKTIDMLPNSCGTWPFEDMWDESGERREAEERKDKVESFFEELKEAGKAGLIFYYCNYDNPVSGDDKKYLLAGIARIKKVHPFIYWDDIPDDQKELYGGYIWSRHIENEPTERMRLPYQEYLAMEKDVQPIAVFAEGDLSKSFKYVAHHVTDDNAISLIDKTIASVKIIIRQAYLAKDQIQQWEEHLQWLQNIRKECWISRGLYPGLASVLRFLGMERPEEFIRIHLKDLPVNTIKDYFFDRFEGNKNMSDDVRPILQPVNGRYNAMLLSGNENEEIKAKLCRDKLPYFDLAEDQVKNILSDKRGMHSIFSSLQTIYNNPYIIAEEYTGTDVTDFVNFEKIDHGMVPSEDLGDVERISLDDPRRLRCLMHSMLKESATEGHSFLEWTPLAEMVNEWHEQHDKTGLFNFDLTTWNQNKDVFAPKVVEDRADGIHAIYLKSLNDAERKIRNDFLSLIRDEGIATVGTDWNRIIQENNTTPNSEQARALEKLYTSRLSVLTGTAGTGKTTVMRSLVQGIKQHEPRHDFLLLAPTGKAALILRDRINDPNVQVMTIHGFLMRQGWINKNNFTLKVSGGDKSQASTVVVDECSMIETMLFSTMLRALDMNNIERLIMVGDYNQLPPIGPGKIYFDLIKYLKKEEIRTEKHLAELHYNWRQAQGSKASLLASHYAKVAEIPEEDIFTEIEGGRYDLGNRSNTSDLVIQYWKDEEELYRRIPEILDYAISRLGSQENDGDLGARYNKVHGIPFEKNRKIEAINLIAPYRHTPTGVDSINLEIQKTLRGKEAVDKWSKYGFVFNDKILQVRNFNYYAWDHKQNKKVQTIETYIPNGTLGYFLPNKKRKIQIKFPKNYDQYSFYPTKRQVNEMLELGYATSVHKAQGSQFDITILVIPSEDSDFLNREMLYTALTRSTAIQIILIQNDISLLKSRLWLGKSDIIKRNSSLFSTSKGIPSKDFEKYKPENLIIEVLPDLLVRSEGERIISEALVQAEIGFFYEKPLISKDNKSFKLPDFTFKHRRKEFFWEHNGMLKNFDYAERAEKKRRWYHENGFQDSLIETPIEGMNLKQSIEYVFDNILNIQSDEK